MGLCAEESGLYTGYQGRTKSGFIVPKEEKGFTNDEYCTVGLLLSIGKTRDEAEYQQNEEFDEDYSLRLPESEEEYSSEGFQEYYSEDEDDPVPSPNNNLSIVIPSRTTSRKKK